MVFVWVGLISGWLGVESLSDLCLGWLFATRDKLATPVDTSSTELCLLISSSAEK